MIMTFDEFNTMTQFGASLAEALDDYDLLTDMPVFIRQDGSLSFTLGFKHMDVPSDTVFNPDKWHSVVKEVRSYINGGDQ